MQKVILPPNAKNFKLALVWNDPPANPNAFKSLINDLDLELTFTPSGKTWEPWVLNSTPNVDSLGLLATRKRDSINVVEQITLDTPQSGHYIISVRNRANSRSSQQFSMAYQWDTTNNFKWHYPTKNDHIIGNFANIFRWDNNINAVSGTLAYSVDRGSKWDTISTGINLEKNYFEWNAPDTSVVAIARMTIKWAELYHRYIYYFKTIKGLCRL